MLAVLTAPKLRTLRPPSWALAAALVLGACGAPAEPEAVETCLRGGGLSVARQPGVKPPVETKINFTTSGTPRPGNAGSVTYYASKQDAARALAASERLGESLTQQGSVLYSPYIGGGSTPEESKALVENCVANGADDEEIDSDKKKKRKKR